MNSIVVAAAGNNSLDEMFFPAALDGVLSVASTTSSEPAVVVAPVKTEDILGKYLIGEVVGI